MKVYVVIGWRHHEGNDEPIGVFSTRDLAEKAAEAAKGEYEGHGIDIQEYDLDVSPKGASKLAQDAEKGGTVGAERGTPHKVMTPEEYAAQPIEGWHSVCRDVDGAGNTGVRYHG